MRSGGLLGEMIMQATLKVEVHDLCQGKGRVEWIASVFLVTLTQFSDNRNRADTIQATANLMMLIMVLIIVRIQFVLHYRE